MARKSVGTTPMENPQMCRGCSEPVLAPIRIKGSPRPQGPGRCENPFLPPPKHQKKQYEVHLEVARLERHAIFRRSISLDDVDCFDTLKSQTYQWHEFITLLFQELRGPFRVVLMRASCQSRFLCDVIKRNRTLTSDTNSSHCSSKGFEVLSELF